MNIDLSRRQDDWFGDGCDGFTGVRWPEGGAAGRPVTAFVRSLDRASPCKLVWMPVVDITNQRSAARLPAFDRVFLSLRCFARGIRSFRFTRA